MTSKLIEMQIMKQKVEAKKIMRMIDARLANITSSYIHCKSNDDKVTASAMAEVKWEMAELKMQFCDLLVEQLNEAPHNIEQ